MPCIDTLLLKWIVSCISYLGPEKCSIPTRRIINLKEVVDLLLIIRSKIIEVQWCIRGKICNFLHRLFQHLLHLNNKLTFYKSHNIFKMFKYQPRANTSGSFSANIWRIFKEMNFSRFSSVFVSANSLALPLKMSLVGLWKLQNHHDHHHYLWMWPTTIHLSKKFDIFCGRLNFSKEVKLSRSPFSDNLYRMFCTSE